MHRIKLIIISLLLPFSVLAQYRDAGLWADFNITADFKKKWQFAIDPEVRMNENITHVSRAFSDFAVQYKFNKSFFTTLTFRSGVSDAGAFYEPRQRWQLGLGFRAKWNDFTFTYQPRWQLAVTSFSNETDADFIQTLRNRFQIKYGINKKLNVASSFETFNNTSAFGSFELQNWRWIASMSRDLNKHNSFTLGYMLQRSFTSVQLKMDYIFLVTYQIQIDLEKKKDKKSKMEKSTE